MGPILEEARIRAQEEFDRLAPNTEHDEVVDADEGPRASEEFALYLPEYKGQENYDIGIEFNAKGSDSDLEIQVRRLPDAEYYARVRSLNAQQHEFFTDVLKCVRDQSESFSVFLSGGAGVGN